MFAIGYETNGSFTELATSTVDQRTLAGQSEFGDEVFWYKVWNSTALPSEPAANNLVVRLYASISGLESEDVGIGVGKRYASADGIVVADAVRLEHKNNPLGKLKSLYLEGNPLDNDAFALFIPELSKSRKVSETVHSNVNEPPSINPVTFSLPKNSPNGAVVGTVTASDLDAGTTLTWSITAGNTGNAFIIDGSTGQITVNNSAALNFEDTPTFTLAVQATDTNFFGSATVTINPFDFSYSANPNTPGLLPQPIAIAISGDTFIPLSADDPDVTLHPTQTTHVRLDGKEDYISIPVDFAGFATPYTLEFWFNTDDAGRYQDILSFPNDRASIVESTLRLTGGHLELRSYDTTPNPNIYLTTNLLSEKWYHIAIQSINSGTNPTTRMILSDEYGVVERSEASDGFVPLKGAIEFGRAIIDRYGPLDSLSHADGYFGGEVDEVRLWNYLRDTVVQNGLPERFPDIDRELLGNESGLIGYWKMNQGEGTILRNHVTGANLKSGDAELRVSVNRVLDLNNNVAVVTNAAGLSYAFDARFDFWFRTTANADQFLVSGWNEAHRSQKKGATIRGTDNEWYIALVDGNQIEVSDKGNLYRMTLPGERLYYDGNWHLVSVSRTAVYPTTKIEISYSDHKTFFAETFTRTDWQTLQVSSLVIGQDQDNKLGFYENDQAFVGQIDDVLIVAQGRSLQVQGFPINRTTITRYSFDGPLNQDGSVVELYNNVNTLQLGDSIKELENDNNATREAPTFGITNGIPGRSTDSPGNPAAWVLGKSEATFAVATDGVWDVTIAGDILYVKPVNATQPLHLNVSAQEQHPGGRTAEQAFDLHATTGAIYGRVLGGPNGIDGQKVRLTDSTTSKETWTDANGGYSFGDLANATYTVTLLGENDATITTASITISQAKRVHTNVDLGGVQVLAGKDQLITAGSPVTLEPVSIKSSAGGTVTGMYQWSWRVGDGPENLINLAARDTTLPLSADTFTPPSAGTFTVTLTVVSGGMTYKDSLMVVADPADTPTLEITPPPLSPFTTLRGIPTSFELGRLASTGAGPWQISVDWGDGEVDDPFTVSSAGTPLTSSHTYQQKSPPNIPYTVTVTAINSGQTASTTFQVDVIHPPLLADIVDPGSVSQGDTVELSANVTGGAEGYQYAWKVEFPGQPVTQSSNATFSLKFDWYGAYTISLTVTDADGNTESSTLHLDVADIPPELEIENLPEGIVVHRSGWIAVRTAIYDHGHERERGAHGH